MEDNPLDENIKEKVEEKNRKREDIKEEEKVEEKPRERNSRRPLEDTVIQLSLKELRMKIEELSPHIQIQKV